MNPDPHTPGDVGLIPGLLLYILLAWLTRAQKTKISKTEDVTLNIFTYVTIYVLMFAIHLTIGIIIVGAGVLLSPFIEAVPGFNVETFIRTYILVNGWLLSLVWIAVIGALPSMFVPIKDWLNKRKKARQQ